MFPKEYESIDVTLEEADILLDCLTRAGFTETTYTTEGVLRNKIENAKYKLEEPDHAA